ncbi:hypothetical protein NPIL_526081 [Nephila pilipes]|uniref:Uncharacterized protein n=1 Tax=Nephila pilipes TaxID=299642 RepID=A0A8X6UB01_NEPPI|nr:hypothetical protein NPIL_526081 [Nephila pilipes]
MLHFRREDGRSFDPVTSRKGSGFDPLPREQDTVLRRSYLDVPGKITSFFFFVNIVLQSLRMMLQATVMFWGGGGMLLNRDIFVTREL